MGAVVMLPVRGHGNRAPDGRRAFDLLPGCAKGRAWMYAVGLSDGRIKIGMTRQPRKRVGQLWMNHGSLLWAHAFQPVPDALIARVERRALMYAATTAKRLGKSEFFTGMDKSTALRIVRVAIADALRQEVRAAA